MCHRFACCIHVMCVAIFHIVTHVPWGVSRSIILFGSVVTLGYQLSLNFCKGNEKMASHHITLGTCNQWRSITPLSQGPGFGFAMGCKWRHLGIGSPGKLVGSIMRARTSTSWKLEIPKQRKSHPRGIWGPSEKWANPHKRKMNQQFEFSNLQGTMDLHWLNANSC